MKESRGADVIFLNKEDGSVIPLRVRVADDDGEYRTYKVEQYRELPIIYETKPCHSIGLYDFECIVYDFGVEKRIYLFYNMPDNRWFVRNQK